MWVIRHEFGLAVRLGAAAVLAVGAVIEGGNRLYPVPEVIVSAAKSGGTHTSRTMMLSELESLLDNTPVDATAADLKSAIVDHNVLGKNTMSGRKRSHRYLRELYALDPNQLLFRALRDLWDQDPARQPLLALLVALASDPLLRATSTAITGAPQGAVITPDDLTAAVQLTYPHAYSDSIAAKIGRNTASSWTQSGHLAGRTNKTRSRVDPTPPVVALALLIAHSEGLRGEMLFETTWCKVLDRPRDVLLDLARRASQRGLLEMKHGGGVTEISFRMLMRPFGRDEGE